MFEVLRFLCVCSRFRVEGLSCLGVMFRILRFRAEGLGSYKGL